MRPMRRACLASLVALVAVLVLAVPASAQDPGALKFLQETYRVYKTSVKGIDFSSDAKAARYFVPALVTLFKADLEEQQKTGEVGRIDFDVFTGGQDWDLKWGRSLTIQVAPGTTAETATGTVQFMADVPVKVTLDLQKIAAGWRIADIRWSNSPGSLVEILSAKE